MPYVHMHLDPIHVPGPSAERHAPLHGCMRDSSAAKRRVNKRSLRQPAEIKDLRKIDVEEWRSGGQSSGRKPGGQAFNSKKCIKGRGKRVP